MLMVCCWSLSHGLRNSGRRPSAQGVGITLLGVDLSTSRWLFVHLFSFPSDKLEVIIGLLAQA
jgi:hypothetical protein